MRPVERQTAPPGQCGAIGMSPTQRQPNVVVPGGGSWGTTIASICARRGPTLQWVRAAATAKDINENHCNSGYLGNLPC
jgi:glycerol-3-phosphate dehydrogenase (NAD(P)+)